MKICHLSHTDLDGYSAQLVTKTYLKNVEYFNSNYGKEIDEKFSMMVDFIGDDKGIILITDLNLTLKNCQDYENLIKDKDIKLLLLDHHQTGLECSKKHSWYYLDSSRCATLITYKFFAGMFGENEALKRYCEVVNSVDIWLKDSPDFELGKVLMGIVSGAKEINKVMFPKKSFDYILYLMQEGAKFIDKDSSHIRLDEALHGLKKDFFKDDKDDTLSNLNSNFIVNLLSQESEKFEIKFGDYKGILTHNIGNTSVIGNDFLVQNPNFDFFLDVTSKKTLSFRSNGDVDVSLMASKLVDGGGHKNASGGLFASFKDGFNYDLIKAQIVNLIKTKGF